MEIQKAQCPAVLKAEDIVQEAGNADLHQGQVAESMKMLNEEGYIKATYTTGSTMPYCLQVTDRGFDQYGRVYLPDYESLVKSVGFKIVNSEEHDSLAIAESLGISSVIVERILGTLESKDYIELFHETGPVGVSNVSPRLRQWLEET